MPMILRYLFAFVLFGVFSGCSTETNTSEASEDLKPPSRPIAIENGKFLEQDGQPLLWGGKDADSHFDISNLSLERDQFHYGIGRERFPALLQPSFTSVEKADTQWADTSRFLVAYAGEEVKAYSVEDLTRHEVVNDELNGEPIMAAYCILADLGAIYERAYGDDTLTFALSGYTYYDPEVWDGLDGFVLWDRETESLWWPLIGKSVSGPLKGVQLLEMDKSHWLDTDWATVKAEYPEAQVLISGQDFERPSSWPALGDVSDIVEEYGVEK